jgi:hypothetical protein
MLGVFDEFYLTVMGVFDVVCFYNSVDNLSRFENVYQVLFFVMILSFTDELNFIKNLKVITMKKLTSLLFCVMCWAIGFVQNFIIHLDFDDITGINIDNIYVTESNN